MVRPGIFTSCLGARYKRLTDAHDELGRGRLVRTGDDARNKPAIKPVYSLDAAGQDKAAVCTPLPA